MFLLRGSATRSQHAEHATEQLTWSTFDDGDDVAWDTVRLKLQEIISHEDKQNPLSDDDLVAELGKHGLTVARRTVTKYRKAMNIPSSRQRRDWTLVGSSRQLPTPGVDDSRGDTAESGDTRDADDNTFGSPSSV